MFKITSIAIFLKVLALAWLLRAAPPTYHPQDVAQREFALYIRRPLLCGLSIPYFPSQLLNSQIPVPSFIAFALEQYGPRKQGLS